MRPAMLFFAFIIFCSASFAQSNTFTVIKNNAATSVKNQYSSGTCWCFSTTAMAESELLKTKGAEFDLSETFTVYNIYIDKAIKYMRRRGNTRFTEGGLSQDMLYAIENYGAMPQSVYPGIGRDTIMARNYQMADILKVYLDDILSKNPDTLPTNWKDGFISILESYIGKPPTQFEYNGRQYTPQSFAAENVTVKSSDFIGLTSFTHHPWYQSFVMEVPDNYNSNAYTNLPLNELMQTVKSCLQKGYTLTWDADVSNSGFQSKKGIAMWTAKSTDAAAFPNFTEQSFSPEIRQDLFDKQVTQDDHLMLITGLAKDAAGKDWFIVKNSYGNRGPYNGYVYVSMPYFAINTISVLVNKKALPKALLNKFR